MVHSKCFSLERRQEINKRLACRSREWEVNRDIVGGKIETRCKVVIILPTKIRSNAKIDSGEIIEDKVCGVTTPRGR
jgi:hypothetical protein